MGTRDKIRRNKENKKESVADLLKEILENKDREVELKEIFKMIEDILRCLEGKEDEECKTNQEIVGMQ